MIRLSKILAAVPNKFVKHINARCLAAEAVAQRRKEMPGKQHNFQPSPSFALNIFRGTIETSQVFPYPEPLTEDQLDTVKLLVDPVEKFYEEINDPAKNDELAKIDEKTEKALWELGAFGLQVPLEYGGLGLNNTQYSRCVEICGYHDLGVGITLGAHQSIGFKGILLFGTPAQKEKYLPRVTGGQYAAFCLTEPGVGSNADGIKCRAVKSADGSHYVLNGSKLWISNGGIAEIMTVFAKVPMRDPNTGQTVEKSTGFIVERGFGGVTSGPPEKKMGIRCSNTAEVFFDDVKVPAENLLGAEGEGFKVAMAILNNGRFGMAAALSGTMRYCIKRAVEHATQREQFGSTIDTYGTTQEKLGRMAILQYVTETLAYMISGNMDSGSTDYSLEAAISKCFASESAWWVCDETIQILGGMGFMKDAGVERILRDLRIFRIFEGTNDLLRLFIALTGVKYVSRELLPLARAMKNPASNLGLIFSESMKRASRNIGLDTSNFSHLVHPRLANHAMMCSKNIMTFGKNIEICLGTHREKIIDEQYLLNRIAQIVFDIYTMAAVLSRATMSANKNLPTAEYELLMAESWCMLTAERLPHLQNVISSAQSPAVFNNLSKISKNVCEAGGCVHINPLGF